MSVLVFIIPEVKSGVVTSHKDPLLVVSTAWTAEGHPNGQSTTISYPVDLRANHGITDAGVASFRFDVPVERVLELAASGAMVDLRGHVPHRT